MHQHERYQTAKKVTLFGGLCNTFLGVIKCAGGIVFQSHALFADGLHSFSDLLTDAMVLFASKYGSQHADDSHPYGHQRIETAATFFLSMLIIITGFAIAWDSLYDLFYHQQRTPTPGALSIALISIVINEGLFYYTRHMGRRIKSDLLIANAWHHRSDAASSLIVLAGITASLIGFTDLDAIAATIVGLLIIHMGLTYSWNSIKELIDTAVDSKQTSQIRAVIKAVEGVKKVHQLRTRSMGRDIFIDVHVIVSPFISVSEGHYIAQTVHHELMNQVTDVKDVTVHIDPEDDEAAAPSLNLLSRKKLESLFLKPLKKQYPTIQSWIIHYLDGKIMLDLICTPDFINTIEYQQYITRELNAFKHAPISTRMFILLS